MSCGAVGPSADDSQPAGCYPLASWDAMTSSPVKAPPRRCVTGPAEGVGRARSLRPRSALPIEVEPPFVVDVAIDPRPREQGAESKQDIPEHPFPLSLRLR